MISMKNVQAFETMNKLKEINGYVRLTLDKLPGIRADLVSGLYLSLLTHYESGLPEIQK